MADARFITAIGTPLDEQDRLLVEGLAEQLNDQAEAGIDSLLVGGTMGLLPMQRDETWKELVTQSVALSRGRFELLVGATDISTGRILDRIRFLNTVSGTMMMWSGKSLRMSGRQQFISDAGQTSQTLHSAFPHSEYD